jgi:hypothetical protein
MATTYRGECRSKSWRCLFWGPFGPSAAAGSLRQASIPNARSFYRRFNVRDRSTISARVSSLSSAGSSATNHQPAIRYSSRAVCQCVNATRSHIQRPSTYRQTSARRIGRGPSISHRPVVKPMPQRPEVAALIRHERDLAVISGDREYVGEPRARAHESVAGAVHAHLQRQPHVDAASPPSPALRTAAHAGPRDPMTVATAPPRFSGRRWTAARCEFTSHSYAWSNLHASTVLCRHAKEMVCFQTVGHGYERDVNAIASSGTGTVRPLLAAVVRNSRAVRGRRQYRVRGYHAVLWEGGTIVDLGTLPGGTSSTAGGINDRGLIAGTSSTPSLALWAVVWKDGIMTLLGTLPVQPSAARLRSISVDRSSAGAISVRSCGTAMPSSSWACHQAEHRRRR